MRSLLILAFSCLASTACVTNEKPSSDAVVVRVLDSPLPTTENENQSFLWKTFANKPEEQQFASYGVAEWKTTFGSFAKRLVEKANAQGLDSVSLEKMLELVLKDSKDMLVYLPVGAYQTTCDGKPVWIITVKWESPAFAEKSGLSHVRMFAFEQKTLKRVGFITCK